MLAAVAAVGIRHFPLAAESHATSAARAGGRGHHRFLGLRTSQRGTDSFHHIAAIRLYRGPAGVMIASATTR
jgi:hypothetical protein